VDCRDTQKEKKAMQKTTFREVQEALRTIDPDILREIARQLAESHVTVCGLTSQEGDCSHITGGETRARIDKLSLTQLADLVAPTVWISTELHAQERE
jgi:hypothetical protein